MRIRSALAATVLTLSVSSVIALADSYVYRFDYTSDFGHTAFTAWPGDSRGNDSHDVTVTSISSSGTYLLFRKQGGVEGWDANDCFLSRDARPALQAGETEVFNDLYYWAGSASAPRDVLKMGIWESVLPPGVTYRLLLVQIPTGVTYTGPTEWGPEHIGNIALPFFATDDFSKSYKFQAIITAPVVPEPSSLLALACGTGLGAIVLRRRRR